MAFPIEFSPDAHDHLSRLRKRDQRIIVDAIAIHLTDQAEVPTRHRTRLELVVIVAIEQKAYDRLRIGDEEVEL